MSVDTAGLEQPPVDEEAPEHWPNLLSVLLRTNGWSAWGRFEAQFDSAARRAAQELANPRLARVTASKLTFNRWVAGTQHPRGDAATVLECLLGVSVQELLAPAPSRDVVIARPPSNASLHTLRTLDAGWQTSTLLLNAHGFPLGGMWQLHGRTIFDGTLVPIQIYEAAEVDDLALIGPEDQEHLRTFVRPTRRALILASTAASGGACVSVLDAALGRRHLSRDPGRVLPVPCAYRLDPLTYAILWSAVNVDDALGEDDHALAAAERAMCPMLEQDRSAIGGSTFPDLSRVGAAWLGSRLCLSYSERQLSSAPREPTASWSRLRTGEECAMWLLFRSEQTALAASGDNSGVAKTSRTRVLCIPKHVLEDTATHLYERILVFLAATAMELNGLTVVLCTDPDYADVHAFELVPGHSAVVASWSRTEGIWHAEQVVSRPQLLMYAEAIRYAVDTSTVTGRDHAARLRSLAEYLQLDWPWLVTRSRELGAAGVAGMLRARSRQVTFSSLDRALRFLGGLPL